jgi:hypothetical protein
MSNYVLYYYISNNGFTGRLKMSDLWEKDH